MREQIHALLRRVGYPVELVRGWQGSDQPWVHPGRATALDRDGFPVGFVAYLHPRVLQALGLPTMVAVATIDVRALLGTPHVAAQFQSLPVFPELPVDIALLVPEATTVASVAEFLTTSGRKLVRSVKLFEVYDGEGIPAGKKSLNFTVTLGAADRTLTDKDERRYIDKIRQQAGGIGAELRG